MRALKPLIALLALFALPQAALAEMPAKPEGLADPLNLSTPQDAVYSLFRAMYLGDASLVDQIFLEDGQLRRVTNTGEVRPDGLKGWRDWVGAQEEGAAVEEIFDIEVRAFGHLASVWAPYWISYQGELIGCGVNEFVLTKTDTGWRIIYGMDTQASAETDCATFKATYGRG